MKNSLESLLAAKADPSKFFKCGICTFFAPDGHGQVWVFGDVKSRIDDKTPLFKLSQTSFDTAFWMPKTCLPIFDAGGSRVWVFGRYAHADAASISEKDLLEISAFADVSEVMAAKNNAKQ